MKFQAQQKPRRVDLFMHLLGFRDILPATPQTATEADRERLRDAQARLERQVLWNGRSMSLGLLLGSLAAVVAALTGSPWARWPLTAAAVLEFGVIPCYTMMACRRLRRIIELTSFDLKSGFVGDGTGKIRSLFGFVRVIEDARTGRLRRLPSDTAEIADLPTGTVVTYRFALRSGLVLSLEATAKAECGKPAEEPCRRDLSSRGTCAEGVRMEGSSKPRNANPK